MAGLRGKVVLVTGASSGIGQGTAIHLASLGCKLSLIARNMEALNSVSEKCKEAGSPDVYIASHDLADEKECLDAVNETVKHFGGNVRNGRTFFYRKQGLRLNVIYIWKKFATNTFTFIFYIRLHYFCNKE